MSFKSRLDNLRTKVEPKPTLKSGEEVMGLITEIRIGLSTGQYSVSEERKRQIERELNSYEKYAKPMFRSAWITENSITRPGYLYFIKRDLTLTKLELEGKVVLRK